MTQKRKAPIWFWIAGTFALIWNAIGLRKYAGDVMMSATDFAALTQVEQNLYANSPYWATAAFAIAVIAGFLGAVMLLLRRPIAVRLFLLSLIAVMIQFSSYFILDGYVDYLNQTGWWMPISIPVFAVIFFLFARSAEKTDILRKL